MDGDSQNVTETSDASSTPPPTPSPAASGGNPPPVPELDNAPLNSRTPPASQPQPQAPQLTPTPMVKPKRGGLAGAVDDMLDDIAGTKGQPKVTQGTDGNFYVETPALSRKGQWLKIAAEAIHGAAAGAAHMQGPGAAGRGFAAGVEAGDKLAAQQRDEGQQATQEARQKNQDLFNAVKLKHDMAAKDFELSRLKVQGTQEDVKFAQEQIDRERKLGSADLGVYKDEADLARVKEQNPNFWKDVYKNNIVAVPEVNEDGTRQGIHVFLRTPGVGSQLAEPGTPIKVFTPGKTPKDPPTLTDQIPTVPLTHDLVDAYNASALNKMRQWQIDNSEEALRASEIAKNNAEAGKAHSEISKNNAEAGKANAEAKNESTASSKADPFGRTTSLPGKEFDKRYDSFGKAYVQPLTKADQALSQFAGIQADIDKNGNMTGAQSVVGLFNAIGISASPLKGSGFRVNANTIAEHENARGLGQSLYQKLLGLKSGDVITPQQLKDYASLAERARESQYFSAIDEARRQDLPLDFLPRGDGGHIDTSTARLYMRAAGNDAAKARTAAEQAGWQP